MSKYIIEKLTIDTVGNSGAGIGRMESGKVVFVDKAFPGDIVDVRIHQNKRDYIKGSVSHLHHPSPLRASPFCKHAVICGGCRWQFIEYDQQLALKRQIIRQAFQMTGNLAIENIPVVLPSPKTTGYRNKLDFAFTSKRWLTLEEIARDESYDRRGVGYHIPGNYDKVFHVEKCYLQPEPSNAIRLAAFAYAVRNNLPFYDIHSATGLLRGLIIRNNSAGEFMIILHINATDEGLVKNGIDSIKSMLDALMAEFPEIISAYYVLNPKPNDSLEGLEAIHHAGKLHLLEKVNHRKYIIYPLSFFQVNFTQLPRFLDVIREFASLEGHETVYDIYCGSGAIGLYLADRCEKLVGVETVEDAIRSAEENARLNHLNNATFVSGDALSISRPDFAARHGKPDLVIVDPPRAGLHKKVVKALLKLAPSRIIYVSCNPVTQARDIARLTTDYEITRMQPIDMFPHTPHVENIVLLTKKETNGRSIDAKNS